MMCKYLPDLLTEELMLQLAQNGYL